MCPPAACRCHAHDGCVQDGADVSKVVGECIGAYPADKGLEAASLVSVGGADWGGVVFPSASAKS